MINKREGLPIMVLIVIILLIAYFAIYLPLEQNQNSEGQGSPPGQNIPKGYIIKLNKYYMIYAGSEINHSIDLGSYSNISAISLIAYSNQTPANLNLEENGLLFNQIFLPNTQNASISGTTFAAPPYIKLYGGIWYLNIYGVNVTGQIHVIVSIEPP